MRLMWHGDLAGDLPIAPLSEASPEYDRPYTIPAPRPIFDNGTLNQDQDPGEALLRLIGGPNLASRRWIWEQYDHLVRGDTIRGPGGDAAVIRIGDGPKGLAAVSDCTPRYCVADPIMGGRQAVVEAWRNLIASGAKPLSVTDNLNFGNPEKPEIMGQFVGCIQGMGEACRALDFPVVSGNVSLYNETNGEAILPTPTIGAIGIVTDVAKAPSMALAPSLTLVLIGETQGWLGASRYLAEIEQRSEGAPPPVDLNAEKRNGGFVAQLIEDGVATVAHDLSGGGIAVGVAKMAMAGGTGAVITMPASESALPWLYGEDQARYIVAVSDADAVLKAAESEGVPAIKLGMAGGDTLTVSGVLAISMDELTTAHEGWLPTYMAEA
jgi:phosphoribosylformylglycinamidine synthase